MEISNIKFFNFRNLEEKLINFNKSINFFYGKNGHGKTNILEALYFSITGKSFRDKNIKDIIKYGFDSCGTRSSYIDNKTDKNIGCIIKNGKREYHYNGKKITFDDYIGKVPVLSFSPDDIELITGNPSSRRDYFDYEISQTDHSYYILLKEFNKILKIRNTFIKEKKIKTEMFEIYNEKFMVYSAEIYIKRLEYIKNLSMLLNLNYRKIFDDNSEIYVKYKNFLDEELKSKELIIKKIKEKYLLVKEKELYLGYSLIGPQRDDYNFMLNQKDSKYFSSQGEKKSIVFSIKISEIDIIYKNKKERPIFIIDDLGSYFDVQRIKSLISYFEKRKIQLFISSTEKIDMEAEYFFVEKGLIND